MESITTATLISKKTIQTVVAILLPINPLILEMIFLLQMQIHHHPTSPPPPTTQLDCSKTPKDPACPPKTTPPKVDCIANPTDPLCPPATPAPKEENNTSSVKKAAWFHR